MRVGIGETTGQQHLVRAQPGARHGVVRRERRLLHLGVVIRDVAIEHHLADVDQRVIAVRPHLGQVEGVVAVRLGIFERHDLHLERPARVLAALDRLVQVPGVVVGVFAHQPVGLGLGEEVHALVGLEVVLHPEDLTRGVDPAVGVAAVAVHVPPGLRDTTVAHQPGDLMRRFRREAPVVPLHVVATQVVLLLALL